MILSNKEFFELASSGTVQLKNIATARLKASPSGYITAEDLDQLISLVMYSGNSKDEKWLKSLKTLHTSGELGNIKKNARNGRLAHASSKSQIKRLVAQKVIPFAMNDYVMVKDTGKNGTVVDYNIDTNEYLVALNPFQLKTFAPKDLMRGKVP